MLTISLRKIVYVILATVIAFSVSPAFAGKKGGSKTDINGGLYTPPSPMKTPGTILDSTIPDTPPAKTVEEPRPVVVAHEIPTPPPAPKPTGVDALRLPSLFE